MTLDLRFVSARSTEPGDALDLLFNAAATPPGGGGGTDPPPGGAPALRAHVAARWSGRAGAQMRAHVAARWSAGSEGVGGAVRAPWGATDHLPPTVVRAPWAASQARQSSVRAPWGSTTPLGQTVRSRWQVALGLRPRQWRAPWQGGKPVARGVRAPWQGGVPIAAPVLARWRPGALVIVPVAAPWGQAAGLAGLVQAPWQTGQTVWSWGGPWVPPALGEPPPQSCRIDEPGGDLALVLRAPASAGLDLVFGCYRPAVVVVPVRRVYVVQRNVTLVRVSDGEPVPCLELGLSLDVDSWAWAFSATLHRAAEPLVQPAAPNYDPVQLDATINGSTVRVLVESIERERVFPTRRIRVSGRSQTAVLAAPFSASSVFSNASGPLTSQQLADQAMPSGWTVDWQITPWLVPTGVWSHLGTPMSAALAIAAAGGAYVQPHATAQQIRILPRYPVAPWDWSSTTPDISLPAAAVQREGIRWVDRPVIDRVFASGTIAGGINGQITRMGTAGANHAHVSDPLITHIDAARQRALPLLADTGRIAMVDLALQVHPATGVIQPGALVQYIEDTTRIGLVRAVSVRDDGLRLRQTITLETHL